MQSVPREWLDFLRQQFPKDSRIQLTEIKEWEKGQLAVQSCFGTLRLTALLPTPAYGSIERVG